MKISIGSISTGTLRSEDLIPTFLEELQRLAGEAGESSRVEGLARECQEWLDSEGRDDDDGALLVDYLTDGLNEYAPSFAYFGSHPGDGSDYGYWADIESAQEQCEYVVSDNGSRTFVNGEEIGPDDDPIPAEYIGEWLHINDHGGVTLYVRDEDGNDEEVWSVV